MKKTISLTLALILIMSTIVSANAMGITEVPIQIENEISVTDIKLQESCLPDPGGLQQPFLPHFLNFLLASHYIALN